MHIRQFNKSGQSASTWLSSNLPLLIIILVFLIVIIAIITQKAKILTP